MTLTSMQARQAIEEKLAALGVTLDEPHPAGRTVEAFGEEVPLSEVNVTLNFYDSGNHATIKTLEAQTLLGEAGSADNERDCLSFLGGAQAALQEALNSVFEVMTYLAATRGTDVHPFFESGEDDPRRVVAKRGDNGEYSVTLNGFEEGAGGGEAESEEGTARHDG